MPIGIAFWGSFVSCAAEDAAPAEVPELTGVLGDEGAPVGRIDVIDTKADKKEKDGKFQDYYGVVEKG
jgi:hypothetical protein